MNRQAHEILLKPLMTEKQMAAQELTNRYFFLVALNADKQEIKRAVEKQFKVSVVKICTMITPGKVKRRGKGVLRTPALKKAAITLKEGQHISLFEGV